jgi:hypothetical protein
MIELREISKALAARIPTRWTETLANYAAMRENPSLLPPEYVVSDRAAYFARIGESLGGPGAKLLFLEFGVLDGASIRQWCGLNANPESRFVGFDSFEGLPTAWRGREAGYFDRGGQMPAIDDARVRFVKGWFNRTLPGELDRMLPLEPGATLLVHIDADLYTSALYCLTSLAHRLPAFHVMFDEYGAGEARALRDVTEAYGARFTPVLGLKRGPRSPLPTRVFGRLDELPGA